MHSEDLILLETRRKALALKSLGISIFVSDTVLNDADPSLKKSDTFGDGEISIAVDPKNTDRVVMSAVSGGPDSTVLLWLSTDGGTTWTKELTINSPWGCRCDDTAELGQLYGLTDGINTFTGPSGAYNNFNLQGFALPVDHLAGLDDKEHPWLLTGRSTSAARVLKNISIVPRDFSTAQPLWMAIPAGMDSRMFASDIHRASGSAAVVNLGYRLANDPRSGALYGLFRRRINAGGGDSQNIDYMLNCSTGECQGICVSDLCACLSRVSEPSLESGRQTELQIAPLGLSIQPLAASAGQHKRLPVVGSRRAEKAPPTRGPPRTPARCPSRPATSLAGPAL